MDLGLTCHVFIEDHVDIILSKMHLLSCYNLLKLLVILMVPFNVMISLLKKGITRKRMWSTVISLVSLSWADFE